MPDKKSSKKDDKAADGDEAEAKGGKSKLLPAIVLSIGLLGAGYFVGGGMSGGGNAAPVAAASEVVEEEEEARDLGMLIDLDAININLADGHFLRLAVSLELSEDKTTYVEGKKKKDKTWEFPSAPALDLTLATFSGLEMEELATVEGRMKVRDELFEAIDHAYHGDVINIFFTEFVMQ